MANDTEKTFYAKTSGESRRIIKVIKNKKGDWVVYFSLNKKRMQKSFKSERDAQKFQDEFTGFIAGKRRIVLKEGIAVTLGAVVFEMLEYELKHDLISGHSYATYWNWYTNYFEANHKNQLVHEIDQEFMTELKKSLKWNKKTCKGQKVLGNGSRFHSAVIVLKKVWEFVRDNPDYIPPRFKMKRVKTEVRK